MVVYGELHFDGQTLAPLPPAHLSGLWAITVLASFSFFFSLVLFVYLTYKLVAWQFHVRRQRREKSGPRRSSDGHADDDTEQQQREGRERPASPSQHTVDFALGIDGIFTKHTNASRDVSVTDKSYEREPSPSIKPLRTAPNQFLILIYNLLLADLHQATAFALNASWINRNGVMVGTRVCFTQGLFVSTGDLASSVFILLVAIHTYLSVVKSYRPSQQTFYITIACAWFFVYAASLIPIGATLNGAIHGGYYVRAGPWCWINSELENTRLVTHYLWIFVALGTTSGLYTAIWFSLRQQARKRAASPSCGSAAEMKSDYNPAFLLYPIIYVSCTLPLATGRVATMAGADVPNAYFCFAGAMISCNGFLDCFLFGTTRHAIIFASKYDVDREDTGIKTIAFLQTPKTRQYGNMVWIQGGGRRTQEDKTAGGWWSWQRLAGQCEARAERKRPRSTSQESLRGPGIHMDMVTSVVVEVEDDKEHDIRYPNLAATRPSFSVNGSERSTTRAI